MINFHELLFRQWILNKDSSKAVRDVINEQDVIPYKRCWYYLEKWTSKGWYEYGVTLDLGWLTKKGVKEFSDG